MLASLTIDCPAKLNLFLAVTGRRTDGFHSLVSLVAPVAFGDRLSVELIPGAGESMLTCDDATLPTGNDNLVLRAAAAFARAAGWSGRARFALEKRLPAGAGLGGGSSDAAGALRGLNELLGRPLLAEELATVAAEIGSDCPLFLQPGAVVMRGRGELVTPLSAEVARRLRGRRVLIFKPDFGVATVWAYRALAAGAPNTYVNPTVAESRLAAWIGDPAAPLENLLGNSFEPVVFRKFLGMPVLLEELRSELGVPVTMSGSGSACFALVPDGNDAVEEILSRIRAAWGAGTWHTLTELRT